MKFDLEKAKSGEPIECQEAYGWIEIPFIGVWDAEHVVCKAPWNDKPEIVPVSKLRMAKRKEILFYRVAVMLSDAGRLYVIPALTGVHVTEIEKDIHFLEGIQKDWEMVEVTKRSEA